MRIKRKVQECAGLHSSPNTPGSSNSTIERERRSVEGRDRKRKGGGRNSEGEGDSKGKSGRKSGGERGTIGGGGIQREGTTRGRVEEVVKIEGLRSELLAKEEWRERGKIL